tara:strand:+ start:129 stop:809 length:681 start_codon:yes stop_codon:yes gene_type:complete
MKKVYKIILFLTILLILSTYTPNNSTSEKKDNFLFKIKNIEIINNKIIKKSDLEKKLDDLYEKNIFLISNKDINDPLKKIDFLKSVEVKKRYPNTIIVKIQETKPVGILFKKKTKYIIDSSSNLIDYSDNLVSSVMPSIFGKDAENNFIKFFENLKKNKFPTDKIMNYYYFQVNRWDLELINGKIIKLPALKISEAIEKSIQLLNREDFKTYKVIDLRIDGKIVVE